VSADETFNRSATPGALQPASARTVVAFKRAGARSTRSAGAHVQAGQAAAVDEELTAILLCATRMGKQAS
jgi:hypothetical protein